MKSSRVLALAMLLPGLVLTACQEQGEAPKAAPQAVTYSAPATSDVDPNLVVATVEGESVKMSDMQANPDYAKTMNKFMTDQAQRKYQLQRSALNQMVDEKLLEKEAQKAGKTVEAYVQEQVAAKVTPPTDEELDQLYKRGRRRFRGTFEEEKANVAQAYAQQQEMRVRQALLKDLREQYKVEMNLPYPELPRVDVAVGDNPTKGPETAAVTIIEFSEFQCPYCSRVQPTLKELQDTYGDNIRIAFRDFPLEFHQNAQKAAEAGECAAEQGKFWEMHDKLFANQRALEVENLKTYAQELELDTAKFNECLDSGRMAAKVKEDHEAGKALGVTGTPAFFINGQMFSGALPPDMFKDIIDAELKRKGVATATKPAAPQGEVQN